MSVSNSAGRVLRGSLIIIGNEVLNGTVKDKNVEIAVSRQKEKGKDN